jgi:glycerol kinase
MTKPQPPLVLAIDQGTTSSRALLFDATGAHVATAQQEFKQYFPQPGWVEHDPFEILSSVQQVLADTIKQAAHYPIAAIGITNQRETTVVWDAQTGQPIYPAIVWQSRQTDAICQQLKQDGYTDTVRQTTGLVVDAYFSGSKIKWILDHVPGARRRAEAGELRAGTIDSWLLWHLSTETHNHKTDITNASRTMLLDISTGSWSTSLCKLLDIPMKLLPEVCPSQHVFGHLHQRYSDQNIPIAGIAGDQQAALFGQGCFKAGQAKNTYGTGCFLLMHTGEKPVFNTKRLLTTVACTADLNEIQYALEGAVFVGGAAIQWLRDGLDFFENSSDSENLATSVDSADQVVVVPAFTGLGAPWWDAHARGTILGLTRGTTKAHITRATLDSIAWQTKDLFNSMIRLSGRKMKTLRVDGGASANNYLMQTQADVLGVAVERPAMIETTAFGAAALAAIHVGLWQTKSFHDIAKTGRVFVPHIDSSERRSRHAVWLKAVKTARQF